MKDEKFFSRLVETDSGCIEWTGAKHSDGYGWLTRKDKQILAHRYSYELKNGEIAAGLHVLHTCDNRPCVNPDHLYLGTHLKNMNDMGKRDRAGASKLTNTQALEIRKRRANGERLKDIAEAFGVTSSAVWLIAIGRNHKHA